MRGISPHSYSGYGRDGLGTRFGLPPHVAVCIATYDTDASRKNLNTRVTV